MKTAGNHLICVGLAFASAWGIFRAAAAEPSESIGTRDAQIRQRYEQILERNPFQKRAFDQVFESYLHWEGVDAWVERLSPRLENAESQSAAILLGQIYARQFKTAKAVEILEGVRQTAQNVAASPKFKRLLGTLYYRQGENQKGISLLTQALADLSDLEERSQVSRILGNLFLREGNTERAVEVWKQIAAQSPKDIFAQIELGAIYEENRLWDEAVEVYQRIASLSEGEPYRRCRALRSIGDCRLRAERFPEAIAAYEAALELVSPGNWLFEDVKLRLVQVYEDVGDLAGLIEYVSARLKQNPADVEFRDLLAEMHLRMNRLEKAESEYLAILERNPRHAPTFEKLIALYQRLQQPEKTTDAFEKLIRLFPNDSDYLRRLGEAHWQNGNVELAKQTWERLIATQRADKTKQSDPSQTSTAEQWAELASWYELYEFPEDAIRCYRQALAVLKKSNDAENTTSDKEWSFRLAALLFAAGENDQAVAVWQSTLQPNVASGAEYAEVASILDAHQQSAKAEKLWRIATQKSPENLDFSLQLARNLMRREKFEEAADIFGGLADQTENAYFQNRGEGGRLDAWSQLGILPEKQAKWEKELLENPDSIPVLSRLAKLYQHAGQRESALSLLEKRSQLRPDNVDFRRDLIRAYRANRFVNKAVEELLRLAADDKTRARVYHQELLDVYLALDLRDEAVAAAEKIVELAPADAESRIDLAQVYTLYQRPEEGLQQYRYALRLKPDEPDYHRQHGEALNQQKRWGEAQIAFQKMLDAASDDGVRLSAVAQLAQIHQLQNTADELVADFARRRRNTPKKLSAYKELAHIYQEIGHPNKSLAILEEGLQNVEDKAPALQALVRAAYQAHDFPKVIGYYEQLIAHRGKPSAYEYEKLGNIYAQIGDLAKARETWKQMVEDYSQSASGEKASASQDPKAYDRLADIFQRENLPNEALEYKRQAVELDESNYQRRWEYAQMLAENERSIEAMEQLQKLLKLGDRQQQTLPEETKKKSIRQRRQSAPALRQYFAPYMSPYGPFPFPSGAQHVSYHVSIPYGRPYYGGSLQGTFQEIRPQVILFLASLSRSSNSEDVLIEQFVKTAEDQPKNTQAKRDLMLVYESCGRMDDALATAEEILQLAPHDAALIQQTAFYYAGRRELGKAVSLLEKLAAAQPQYRNQARQTLIPLYFQNQESEKAIALTDQMLEENPNDVQPLLTLAGLMQQRGQLDEAIALHEKAQSKAQGNVASFFSAGLAHLYAQKGDKDKAKDLYVKMLVDDSAPAGFSLRRSRVELYVPSPLRASSPRYYGGSVFRNLPPTLIGSMDYQKAEAMRQLQILSEDDDIPLQPLIDQAKQLRGAKGRYAKDKAWSSAKLLIASYLAGSELDEASRWLDELEDAAGSRVEWFNLALHLAESQDDCDAMMQLYDQAERRFSSQTRKILSAKASVSIRCERYEEAAAYIRQMIQRRFPPKELVEAIRPLSNAGENKLAKELLEEHLSGISRNGEALALLANIYAGEEDYERAIALAREAWDRSSYGGSSRSYRYRGYPFGIVSSAISRSAGGLLQNLHHYYVQAGRSEELIQEFAERLAKQPGSVRLHENLAALYALNNQNDKVIEVYKTLIQKRPHLVQAKQQLARFYSETGNFDKATSIYEQLLKTHPNVYQQISWELRNLYRRSGQGKQILKIEENLAKRLRDPNQLQQLANRFQQSGELEKAAELYKKAIQLSPGHTWMHRQLADVYLKLGKHEDAVGLYKNWLASPFTRAQGGMDGYTLQHLTGVYASAGRLNELKEINQEFMEKNDPLSLSLTAQIAIFEKRFDDAIEHLTKAANTGQNPNAFNDLLDIAEITGRIDEVLEGVQEPMLQQNYHDKGRLAKIYMAKGDLDRGKKLYKDWIEEQAGFGGPVWHYMRQAVTTFAEYGLWDEVEALVRKHSPYNKKQRRRIVGPPSREHREFSRIVAEAYAQHNQLQNIVNETLDKEIHTDADAELFLAIANQYRRNYSDRSESRREAFLSRVVARSPGNTRLVSELIQIHFRNNNTEKAAELARQLAEAEPDNLSHRRVYADALLRNNQAEKAAESARQLVEAKPDNQMYRQLYADALFKARKQSQALAMLSSWASEKETESRYSFLADYQERVGKHAEARASLLKAIKLADASRKPAAELQLARFDAKRGNPEAAKQAYAKQFEQRADARSFKQYFDFLRDNDYLEEARKLFLKHKDRGYLDTYDMDDVFALFTDSENFDTWIDIAWNHFRYAENHRRSSFFHDIERNFQNEDSSEVKAKQKRLLDGLRKRAEEEESPNQEILSLLARTYANAKLKEPAGELYKQLMRQNPFNQDYILDRVRWLAENGQTDEAFQLIEKLPPSSTLYQEAANQVKVIAIYLKHQAPKRAQAAIDKLLAWRGDGDVEIEIGNLFFHEEQYEKALSHYENSLKKYRKDKRLAEQLFINMGKCYALQGRKEDALKAFKKARNIQADGYQLQNISGWLLSNKLYEIAVSWLESSRKTAPLSYDHIQDLAECYIHLNKLQKTLDLYKSHWDQSNERNRSRMQRDFSSLIRRHRNLKELLDQAEPHPLIDQARKDPFSRNIPSIPLPPRRIIDRLQLPADIPAEIRKRIRSGGRRSTFRPPPNRSEFAIESRPTTLKTDAEVLQYFQENKDILLGEPHRFEALFKLAEEETATQLLEKINETASSESEQTYYRFLAAHFQGKSKIAAQELAKIAKNPDLNAEPLKHLVVICQTTEQHESAITFLNQLAKGDYKENHKQYALQKLPELQLKAGDLIGALSNFVKLPPDRQQKGHAFLQALYTSVNQQNLPAFQSALETLIAEQPDLSSISLLVGIYREIHEKLGIQAAPKPFSLRPEQQKDANQLSSMIQSWQIAGPYSLHISSKPPADPAAWTKHIHPKDTFGFIYLDELFGIKQLVNFDNLRPIIVEGRHAGRYRQLLKEHIENSESISSSLIMFRQQELERNESKALNVYHNFILGHGKDQSLGSYLDFIKFKRYDLIDTPIIGLEEGETFDSILSRKGSQSIGKSAYARVALISLDVRSITLAFESDDPGMVWLNGQAIHLFPVDQPDSSNRAQASLKAGENILTIRVDNLRGSWFFNAQIVENGDGVGIQLPTVNSQQTADNKTTP